MYECSVIGAIITGLFVKIKLRWRSRHDEQIGPRVRELREKVGMTQEQLTARCNLLGFNISRGTLAKMESQVRRISDEEVGLLAKALKVDVSELYKIPNRRD